MTINRIVIVDDENEYGTQYLRKIIISKMLKDLELPIEIQGMVMREIYLAQEQELRSNET
jgi:hypothetical protein